MGLVFPGNLASPCTQGQSLPPLFLAPRAWCDLTPSGACEVINEFLHQVELRLGMALCLQEMFRGAVAWLSRPVCASDPTDSLSKTSAPARLCHFGCFGLPLSKHQESAVCGGCEASSPSPPSPDPQIALFKRAESFQSLVLHSALSATCFILNDIVQFENTLA